MRFIAFHAKVALPQRLNPPPRTRVRNRWLRSGYGEALGSGRIAWEGDAMASSANSQPAGSIKLQQRTTKTLEQGLPFPLGATPVGDGVNFAIYSKHAAEVFLLLFDTPDGAPTDVIQLRDRDKLIWHTRVKGLSAGQLYGYKVGGEYRPEFGLRFNDAKLLLDPYAKAVTGKFRNTDNLLLNFPVTAFAYGSS